MITPQKPADSENGSSWEHRAAFLKDGEITAVSDFPFDAVENEADILCETLAAVSVSRPQAEAVLAWHNGELRAEEHFQRATIIARVLGELLASENIHMDIHALAFASGLDQTALLGSQADVARRLRVTRAAVSKCTGKWKDILGYSVQKFTRSNDNREHCRAAQLRNHWRDRRVSKPAQFTDSP